MPSCESCDSEDLTSRGWEGTENKVTCDGCGEKFKVETQPED